MKKFIVTACVLAAVAVVLGGLVFAVQAFQLSYHKVITGSMEPDYPVGTFVVTSGTAEYEPGAPIMFVADGTVVMHALVDYNEDGSLVTRGIANPSNDNWQSPVYPKDVIGKVLFQIPVFSGGFWADLSSNKGALMLLAGVALAALATVIWPRKPPEEDVSTEPEPTPQEAAV